MIRYTVRLIDDYPGEFQFLSSVQGYWCSDEATARREAAAIVEDSDGELKASHVEIYKLTVEKLQ